SAGGGGTEVYIAMTIYILSRGHRHIKPCPNPDVKKPTLRRLFTFQPGVGGTGWSENASI
ncbi:hypothetical protein, partial [Escherichia coli]|uniref:hypothetical protein n=1 Tax=Escherichia coli TaxID=562 RepID=UPI001BDD1956